MFNTSNYYDQSRGLPAKNDHQLMLLKWADTSTLSREISKVGTIVGLVSSVSSLVFNYDPTIPLICTAVSGCSWLLFSTCAKKLEPQAQHMLQYFKDLRDGKEW
jgi:hypothetical protein